ncbi:tRNA (32-2'-O)-methyltransferase regulator THADA-like [Saccoglossus kowalevskii]
MDLRDIIIRVLYLLYPSDLQSTFDKEVSLMWFKQHPIVSHKELQRGVSGLASFKFSLVFSWQIIEVSLQVIQHFIDEIQPLIWQRSDSPLQLHISNIVQYLLYQIFNQYSIGDCTGDNFPFYLQKYSQECGLLSGCIVGLLINTVNNKEQCIRTAIGLLDNCKAVQEHSCIDVNFGKFAFPLDVNTDNYFPTVVLIKAMLSCLDKEILVHPIYNATQEKKITLLYDILFCEVCKCCKAITEVHYHAFQVLTLWLQCVRDTLYLVCRDFKKRMFYEESEYTKIVLQLVFENWENPIVGVAEHIKTSFTLLLEIYEEENKLHLVNDSQFFEELCVKLSTTSWHMKGKYAPLCALIPYIGAIKFLTDHPDVTGNLVSCLATNYLASSACEVYKTFLYNLRKECCESTEDGLASCWSQYWMKSIIEALCHKTQLLRHNASHYWLPWTLKIFPCTYSLIIDELGSHKTDIQPSRCLHTQISVLSAARTLNIMNVTQMDVELIKEALFHLEDDIRSDAVGLLCTVQRKSELVSELELGLLKEFLPFNMNSDSSSFRQHLYAYIKRLLVRIRDSCIAMLKQHDKVIKAKRKSDSICVLPNEFKASIDFVDFLFKLCITSLFPGSCYQRKKTSLDLLLATFETMATEESASTKHGQTTDSIKMLLAWANDNNKWNFFSSEHGNIILHCIEDGTNEIRELSYKILTSYYPWQLTISATQIIHHAYELVSSPKAMQCESGALMWKMIFEKFVCNLGWCFSIVPTSPGILEVAMVTNTDEIKCCKVLFMTQLVDLLKHQYDTSQSNLLKSATITPMHGIVLAIRRCLTETSYVISNIDEWKNVIHQIITVTETIINFMLQILFGKKSNPDTDTSPDFAEMGMAIDEAIVESKDGGNDHEESAVISVEHQLILAYSWLNIKECSLLLGAIAEKLPLCDEFSGVLSTEQIQKMADMFVKVLTKCRHRGAIEGCNLGFMKLCSRLLSSSSQELSSIPKTLLDQVFCLLDSSLSGTSITRRSAGLPLMVETITACEPKGRERSLLKLSMTRLLQTVNHPIPTDTTQTIDLPQVHALNIMKSLFRNSVLGNTMLQYASDVVMVTIEGFSSSSWAIRNSATLLYGTLVARMLGQKRVQDEHSDLNTITAQEFFYRYPKLQSYLLSEVIKASTSNNRLNLHPGLHPVLTLLSKLAVGIQQYSSECALSSFIQPVMELSSSPIYAVRVLSASALVPLVTMEEQPNILSAILDDLPASFDAVKYHNKLHGMLLQIEKLLQSLTSHERFMSSYSSVIGKLQAKLWLAKSDNPCPLTRALYVNILLKCLTNMEDESEKYQQLKLHVFKIVTDFRNENVENLVMIDYI